jgi:hypothetical protein
MGIRERLVDGMRGQGIKLGDQWVRLTDEHLTQIVERVLKTLELREVSNNGRLDDLGFLHMVWDLDVEPQRYVQYISGWHPVDGED